MSNSYDLTYDFSRRLCRESVVLCEAARETIANSRRAITRARLLHERIIKRRKPKKL